MAKVMVADDEKHILELIKFTLEKEGHEIITIENGLEVVEQALKVKPDLIILDLMLPGVDGLEICRELRKLKLDKYIPIIMLTAKDSELDKIIGLELGADDYVTKPFSPRELASRVKARMRRKETVKVIDELNFGKLVIRPSRFQVFVHGKEIKLTLKEFELLKLLATNPGKVFSREFLLDTVWGIDFPAGTRTVDVHIRHLRIKIEDNPEQPDYIDTLRGVGYRFREKQPNV